MPEHIQLDQSLWVYGEKIYQETPNARTEIDAVKERGIATFMLKRKPTAEDFEQLRRRIWSQDIHVVLTRLHPWEMTALKPLFRERKNFSVIYDDWWIMPHWFTREAEYVVFRKYNGLTVRLGQSAWTSRAPSWFYNPFHRDYRSKYALNAFLLRLPMLAVSPLVNLANIYRRRTEKVVPERYLYFPFAVRASDLPLPAKVQYQYDFTNTWNICGIFLMRDPFVPFHHTFANLYADRFKMTQLLLKSGYAFYHGWNRDWQTYVKIIHQSRYAVASGGLCDKFNPNFLECACLGTPMIGRSVPWEAPWFDECLFPVDPLNMTIRELKPVLQAALEQQPVLRENCLNWRDRLLKMYNPHTLLDLLQDQIDGKPLPPGYLKPGVKTAAHRPCAPSPGA
ncbi:MAG TPA: hypothetical protein VFB55_01680 [Verrucomicrobiae bacterium]|nr:hypothetical protein [Verrucomicrobiae bacterium]